MAGQSRLILLREHTPARCGLIHNADSSRGEVPWRATRRPQIGRLITSRRNMKLSTQESYESSRRPVATLTARSLGARLWVMLHLEICRRTDPSWSIGPTYNATQLLPA